MAKTIVKRIDRNLARRLGDARRETGLSARAVAALMPKRVAVSYGAITAYERGTTVPPVDVLAALADIYRRPINWFLDSRESLTAFQFRNLGSRIAELTQQLSTERAAREERLEKEVDRLTDKLKTSEAAASEEAAHADELAAKPDLSAVAPVLEALRRPIVWGREQDGKETFVFELLIGERRNALDWYDSITGDDYSPR